MSQAAKGWLSGLLGVAIFSGSLPATRVAVGSFDPLFLTGARAVIAAALGLILLIGLRQARPGRSDLLALGLIGGGVVLGFPLLTAMALQHMTSAQSMVFIGLLPLSTAIFGVIRGGERPQPKFWLFSTAGSAAVVAFALFHGGPGSLTGDALMIAAIVVCGLGYAEGGVLARRLGGWQVICWALLLASPVTSALTWARLPKTWDGISPGAWVGLAYVSLFSMLIGFIFWYRGLALGGIARVGQLQLLQPFLGLGLAGLLLREHVEPVMIVATGLVVLAVAGARRFA